MIKNFFPNQLKLLLADKGISQSKLAASIGVSKQAVAQFCNGSSFPSIETLASIADYFDVSIDYLVGRSDDPKRH